MPFTKLIDQYVAGPKLLQQAVIGMTDEQLDAKSIRGAIWQQPDFRHGSEKIAKSIGRNVECQIDIRQN